MNLENKTRITKDIVVYENFLSPEVSAKLIKVLDKHVEVILDVGKDNGSNPFTST